MSKPITDPDQLPQVCYKQHIAAANKSERTMIGCADAVIDVLKKALAVRDAKIATLESRGTGARSLRRRTRCGAAGRARAMTSTPQHEPVVSLPSGAAVLLAVYELVTRLQQRGHTLAVDADGDVRVTPDDDLDGDVQLTCSM